MTSTAETEARFAAWMVEHGGIITRVARSHARNERQRDELARELAFQVWQSASRFQANAKPTTWIYRVCLNTAMTWRRNSGRHDQRFNHEADVASLPHMSPTPAAQAERGDLREHLYHALRAMPDADRALLLLQLDEMPYREMAEVLGITENHVGVALNRARQRLTAQLKDIINELD